MHTYTFIRLQRVDDEGIGIVLIIRASGVNSIKPSKLNHFGALVLIRKALVSADRWSDLDIRSLRMG